MYLDIDCGNTLIKWRLFDRIKGAGTTHLSAEVEQLDQFIAMNRGSINGVRVASVRDIGRLDQPLAALRGAVPVQIAASQACQGRLINGYKDPSQMGVDRWLAMLGAFNLAKGACLVIQAGTAITADFIRANGQHLGGTIAPGLGLLFSVLHRQTDRLPLVAQETAADLLAQDTHTAIAGGVHNMVAGHLRQIVSRAEQLFGRDYEIYLAGGDREFIAQVIAPHSCQICPDLVLDGLALLDPV